MSNKLNSVLLGIFLLARTALAGDPIASFAKDSLKFDLASVPFGTADMTKNGYGLFTSSLPTTISGASTNMSWGTNAVSEQYKREFPGRSIHYGFGNGRLVSVQISLGVFDGGAFPDKEKLEQRRDALSKIVKEFYQAKKTNVNEANYHVQAMINCSSRCDDLFFVEFEITPMEKKKSL